MKDCAHFVYFIKAGHAIKIGRTKNIEKRMVNLQNGSSHRLKLVKLVQSTHQQCESYFHKHFRDYRIGGEWFAAGIEPFILEAINSAPAELGIGAESHYSVFAKLFSPNYADMQILKNIISFNLYSKRK